MLYRDRKVLHFWRPGFRAYNSCGCGHSCPTPLTFIFGLCFCQRTFSSAPETLPSDRKRNVAATPPAICAPTNGKTSAGRIPANVSLSDLAIVTAGFANDVDAVNQYAAAM